MTETFDLYPTKLSIVESGDLEIVWSDETVQALPPDFLRKKCPCANCMEKRIAILKKSEAPAKAGPMFPIIPSDAAEPITIEAMEPVGNYAYRIDFSDRHNSGVYTLEYLYSLAID